MLRMKALLVRFGADETAATAIEIWANRRPNRASDHQWGKTLGARVSAKFNAIAANLVELLALDRT
jgi:Flp pilus assembly pilin Flp